QAAEVAWTSSVSYRKSLELVLASLHQFRCFLAAVRTGSFTAAAAELGLAQQSVSEQVRLLERACGVALFIRVGRGLRPTEAAGALAPHAERALAASEQAVAAARAVRDIVAGTVTAEELAKARLVLPYASWAEADTTRRALAARVQATGVALRPVADVDDVETALDVAGRGLADTVANRGLLQGLAGRVPHKLGTAPLRPRLWDTFAVVHRRQTELSPATRAVLEMAVAKFRGLAPRVTAK